MTMSPTAPAADQAQTRLRLLEAAGEVFAEKGFRDASIREICRRANANIAAVNYHFRDKQQLYRELLHYAHNCIAELEAMQAALLAAGPPEERFTNFIRGFLRRILDRGRPAWHGKLIAREMIDPTPALDELVEQDIRPKFGVLRQIVAELLGVPVTHEAVRWYAAGVIAQCLFFFHNRPVIQRLYPDLTYTPEQIEFLAQHVARFSLHGMQAGPEVLRAYERGSGS